MAIPKGHAKNFKTMLTAAKHGDLCLVECTDLNGNPVYTICAVHTANGEFNMTPFAKLFDGNPYEELLPPA